MSIKQCLIGQMCFLFTFRNSNLFKFFLCLFKWKIWTGNSPRQQKTPVFLVVKKSYLLLYYSLVWFMSHSNSVFFYFVSFFLFYFTLGLKYLLMTSISFEYVSFWIKCLHWNIFFCYIFLLSEWKFFMCSYMEFFNFNKEYFKSTHNIGKFEST